MLEILHQQNTLLQYRQLDILRREIEALQSTHGCMATMTTFSNVVPKQTEKRSFLPGSHNQPRPAPHALSQRADGCLGFHQP